jgi:Flp pilus assembly CpaE family ATPase
MLEGRTVLETAPGSPAAAEIRELAREIEALL